ncbi:hydrogenase maturation protease [Desulfobulbus oligotrophicus]|jgi:hydrogenase maturation protease|uniref:Hydrogenase maturation protease n=1 Tax=Desulfobulbus oligotrophicus TaxID=1909699 RepID=A0A7T5VBY2_9BACT|nr:hydrogenase maturation protease [Desulfobulbus oligotrophicus]MDY0390788.1 hydrogenase maturation protease [Desulfobulbus oligotrophicus]QQG65070.1 hydrogenase maturation protease [Desulfobulbus oligotrophicus]
MKNKCVVIGIGNPYVQDDRAGIVVVEQLRSQHPNCQTACIYSAGFEVLDKIRGYENAIIVDACRFGIAPGTILEVTADDILIPPTSINSHTVPLGATLHTGYVCFPNEMPHAIRIFLIEVKEIEEFRQRMSPEIEHSVEEVVNRITILLNTINTEEQPWLPRTPR